MCGGIQSHPSRGHGGDHRHSGSCRVCSVESILKCQESLIWVLVRSSQSALLAFSYPFFSPHPSFWAKVQELCSRWGLRSAVQCLGCWVCLHLWASSTWRWLCLPGQVLYGQSKIHPSGSHLCPWRWVCARPICSTLLWPLSRGLSMTPAQQHTGPPYQLEVALRAQIRNLS